MLWIILNVIVALVGASMALVLVAYWLEHGMARVRRRLPRPRLRFYAELVEMGVFDSIDIVPDGMGSGIDAVYGVDRLGRHRLQSLRFSSEVWRSKDAREWLRRNQYNVARFRYVRR